MPQNYPFNKNTSDKNGDLSNQIFSVDYHMLYIQSDLCPALPETVQVHICCWQITKSIPFICILVLIGALVRSPHLMLSVPHIVVISPSTKDKKSFGSRMYNLLSTFYA